MKIFEKLLNNLPRNVSGSGLCHSAEIHVDPLRCFDVKKGLSKKQPYVCNIREN